MSWKDKRIVVIGDIMLDHYLIGAVDRISPEAPVLVVSKKEDSYVAGGAANVAMNISKLGGRAYLLGVLGNDSNKDILRGILEDSSINYSGVVIDSTRPTTHKMRIVSQEHRHQLLRVDNESAVSLPRQLESEMLLRLSPVEPDAIIISDYAKGVVTQNVIDTCAAYSKRTGVPLIIGPKPANKVSYLGASLVVENKGEARQMLGRIDMTSIGELRSGGIELSDRLNTSVLITLGAQGMALFERGNEPYFIPTEAKQVSDVSGAGDTVIATATLGLTAGLSLRESVTLANKAAGIKVTKLGTAPVHYSELFG